MFQVTNEQYLELLTDYVELNELFVKLEASFIAKCEELRDAKLKLSDHALELLRAKLTAPEPPSPSPDFEV